MKRKPPFTRTDAAQPAAAASRSGSPAQSRALVIPMSADDPLVSLLQALTYVRNGDFNISLGDHTTGTLGEVVAVFNDVVGLNRRIANECSRVSTVVGQEGVMTERANVADLSDGWLSMVTSVNSLIENLAQPTAEAGRVITAVAQGDLTQKMALEIDGRPVKGEFLRIGGIVNTMVDQLGAFSSEVTRVAREVGTEGRLGGQADVKGVSGTWADLTNNVNRMASNLTDQVRNIALVTTAVANGDLSQQVTVDVSGEMLDLKVTINQMVDRLNAFSSEVTRVAREVGTDGKLGGQAVVKDVSGTWADLTNNVNSMAMSLTSQVRNIADVTIAVANGDLSKKITVEAKGEILQLKDTVNQMVDQLSAFSAEVTRVAREVGTDGKLGGQAEVKGVSGTWKDLTENVNRMATNLTDQVRNIAVVTTAVASGDLSKKITVEAKGEILQLKDTINTMVDRLNAFSAEVTRVAKEVGTDGRLGGQAVVKDVSGTWKDLTDNVNNMAGSLTSQVRDIAKVTVAVANGDLSQKITVDARGEILELKNTINRMVDQLNSFANEVTRVAREVGSDGKLGGQAEVKGVAGTWADLTSNVNAMAASLTSQVRNIADVTTAVANGDLSRKITVEAKGEILQLKDTINQMVDQLSAFSAEVTRVAREVGTDGKLGGQAEVKGVSGTWKDLTENVNRMATNLTDQVRNIALVTTAVANGDLSQQITVEARGEILELKNTINRMVNQLNGFANEVTRVAREVGSEGKLGGQAEVKGVAGTWADLTNNVNGMAGSLTGQVRNIAKVTTAVANGDLTQKITVEAKGEILELKDTINRMVDQLNGFSSEVTRVAKEVGVEGKLGGQAEVKGVLGTWKDLTDNVNGMATSLTSQVRDIAKVTTAVANGDLSQKITVEARGEILELKDTINRMVDQLNGFSSEVTRVAREVGTEGKLGGQGYVRGVSGVWKDLTDSVNRMAANLTDQVRNIALVTTGVANGDLSQQITVEARGEILELKNTINRMVSQLSAFSAEVTRVAREVGTDGKLGGQAEVLNVSGTWKGLTDSVNRMATNLTDQVRNIAVVTTAVANGDLSQKITVEAKGEILQLKDTINRMVDRLNAFSSEVTRVAREVGTEGKLGGQAEVRDVSGTWADLTSNVNQLASNLTSQVRAIAEVATAVSQGDLSRSITVDARGEVADLKDNVNRMIGALKETTNRNQEQDWLKTNLAKFTRALQGQRDLQAVCKMTLSELAPLVSAQHGAFYHVATQDNQEYYLTLLASYAYRERKHVSNQFLAGEGLVGQVLLEKERILITDAPEDYIKITSGLGEGRPTNIVVLPVIFEGRMLGIIELASFSRFSDIHLTFLDQLTEGIGIVLNTISANMRTEELLKQSQSLTEELQNQQNELTSKNKRLEEQAKSLQASEELLKQQQEELQQTNEELEEKAKLLSEQKTEVEHKNREVERARHDLVVKADQLALTSKYKSEFLANMSHELRTPLNSLLILSGLLADNADGNLTSKQVEHAVTIKGAGNELLELINEILDLAKIESGTVSVELSELSFGEMQDFVQRNFGHVAEQRNLGFSVEVDPALPPSIRTDVRRVQQVLKNLLSNALKFTEVGSVNVKMRVATHGWSSDHQLLNASKLVVAFSVTDTGIGIPPDKQALIFEAFQQADGTTARRFGGTGLGLSISREIARMLGGTLRVESAEGLGSTFTLYLPSEYTDPHRGGGGDSGRDFGGFTDVPGAPRLHFADGSHQLPSGKATDAEQQVVAEVTAPDVDATPATPFEDDRTNLEPDDRVLLIIEDDPAFAAILRDLARDHGFKTIVALDARTAWLCLRHYQPTAITLDLRLPDGDGWVILDRLKHDSATRHLPIHVISVEDGAARSLRMGALGFVQKPVTREAMEQAMHNLEQFVQRQVRRLLVVEDNAVQLQAVLDLVGNGDVSAVGVQTGAEALAMAAKEHFDCAVVDLSLPDMKGTELIKELRATPGHEVLPIIIYTGKQLSRKEEVELRRLSEAIIIKDVKSPERLVDETALFLHRMQARLPEAKRQMLKIAQAHDPILAGRKVLVVDDDIRNVFALTAALERYDLNIVYAESGQAALTVLTEQPDVDLVLMDVMMPEMDGHETMRRIRSQPHFRKLPILAVTAKAMRGDREKCIESGANDYITKPVHMDQLLSLMRVWLYR